MRIRRQKKACKKCNRFLRYLGRFKRPETECPCEADAGFFDIPAGFSEVVTLPRRRPDQPTHSFKVSHNHQTVGIFENFDDAIAARKNAMKQAKEKRQRRANKNLGTLTFEV